MSARADRAAMEGGRAAMSERASKAAMNRPAGAVAKNAVAENAVAENAVAENEFADDVWSRMVALVMDTRSDWRRRAAEAAELPFSRVRVLRRLAGGPMTLREIAESATIGAPAATLAVNDLERRGLAVRRARADSRRSKQVLLTDAGRRMVRAIDGIRDQAPPGLCELDPAELAALASALDRIREAGGRGSSHGLGIREAGG